MISGKSVSEQSKVDIQNFLLGLLGLLAAGLVFYWITANPIIFIIIVVTGVLALTFRFWLRFGSHTKMPWIESF